jgi:ATP-dependent RNA helicase HelY
VLTEHRWAGRISSADYSGASGPFGSMTLPKRVLHRQPRVRRDLASALRSAAVGLVIPAGHGKGQSKGSKGGGGGGEEARDGALPDPELTSLREQLRLHRAHRAPDRDVNVRAAEKYLRIERENTQVEKKVAAATDSLARTFDRIVGMLTERGFIRMIGGEPEVTDDGRLLARIYSESDLLVAECLRTGAWNDIEPAELAAVLSAVLYESRGGDARGAPHGSDGSEATDAPTPRLRRALRQTDRLAAELRADEQRHRISPSREPDDGFAGAVHRWATTGDLAAALAAFAQKAHTGAGSRLSAGDFVRWCRQVLDLLDQVRLAGPDPASQTTAKRAIDKIRRGVVAVDGG